MFHNTNPTAKYVLAIDDGVAMFFATKEDALKLYNSVASIEESPFGAMCLMAPEQIDKNIYGEVATESILAGRKIVNPDYITKHTARTNAKYSGKRDWLSVSNAAERLKEAKVDWMAALGFEPSVDWRKNRVKVA